MDEKEKKEKHNPEIPIHITKWKKVDGTVNSELTHNFENWEISNAEILNKYFNQWFFKWEESILDTLLENEPDAKFDDIKNEWINLAILQYDNLIRDFKNCLEKTSDEVKKAINEEIFNIWVDYAKTIIFDNKIPNEKGKKKMAKPNNND